jgi:hypothetical protein
MRPTSLVALLALALPLSAQFPIGHATPVSGYAPALFAEPLWIGNPGYGYRIQGAPPGGAAFIGVSEFRQDQVISGLQVYLDLGAIVSTHSATLDAAGRAFISIPLGSPDHPALTGLQFYAQGAVSDPATNALGTTEAVLVEITAHPMLAYTSWAGSLYLVDPVAGTTTPVSGLTVPQPIRDAVFGNGGRDLFLATGTGIKVVDTVAANPQAVNLAPGFIGPLAWDRVHQRLYATDSSAGALLVIDGNRSSPAFGSVIAQTPDASTWISTSADGKQLVLTTFQGVLTRRNGDPTSAGYLQLLPTPPTPFNASVFGTSVDRVHLSPDGRIATVPVHQAPLPATTNLHRLDTVAGIWLDHSAGAAGYQALSIATHPSIPMTFAFHPTRDGSNAILTGHGGSGNAARLDFDLHSPIGVTTATTSAPNPPSGFITYSYLGLTPSGRFLLRQEINMFSPQAGILSLVEVSSGGQTPLVNIPGPPSGGQQPLAVWR